MSFSIRPSPCIARQCRSVNYRSPKNRLTVRAGLFDNLFGGGGGGNSPQAQELVNELLETARRTNGGSRASRQVRERIGELAEELKGYRPRNATRSPLFGGTYEVTYCSNPKAPGGPVLRSPPGQLLAANQRLRQTLQPPNLFQNSVEFKTLGLFPGYATQEGVYKVLSGTRYRVDIEPAQLKIAGDKGVDQGGETVSRNFDVLYLDEQVRVVEYLPEDESESQLFVFERVQEQEEEEEYEGDGAEFYAESANEGPSYPEEEEAEPKLPFFKAFGRKKAPVVEEEEEEEPEPPARNQRGRKAPPRAAAPKPASLSPEEKKKEEIRRKLEELQQAYDRELSAAKETAAKLKELEKESREAVKEARPRQKEQEEAERVAARAEQEAEEAIANQNRLVEALTGARQRLK